MAAPGLCLPAAGEPLTSELLLPTGLGLCPGPSPCGSCLELAVTCFSELQCCLSTSGAFVYLVFQLIFLLVHLYYFLILIGIILEYNII